MAQIERRYARLEAVKHDVPGVRGVLRRRSHAFARPFRAEAQDAYRRLGVDFAEDIAPQFRTLIPPTGAHTTRSRAADGSLHFLDFEYFGWDDPLTSIANFIMHPGMRLTDDRRRSTSTRCSAISAGMLRPTVCRR